MNARDITVWLDERWYDALSNQLKKKDTTVEDALNAYLDALIDQLPEQVRDRISHEIWEEDQRQCAEEQASRHLSVFRVTQDGRTEHLLAEGGASMDAYHTALRLRGYLLAKGDSSHRFAQAIPAADYIAPEVFQDYADELRQGGGRMIAALDIDLDRGEFSTLDVVDGWETYAIRDVSTAAWCASREAGLKWDRRRELFAAHLETRMIRCEGQEMGQPNGPSM